MKIFLLILFGFLGGILGGMGMGGGTVLTPLLTIFLSISQKEAQATNLIAFLPMSIVALIFHCKNKLVRFKQAIPIAVSGIVSSVLASIFISNVSGATLRFWFAIFLIVIGVFQTISIFIFKENSKKSNFENKTPKNVNN